MRVAGIHAMGAPVEVFEVPEPRQLADDEVLIEVMAAGVGNWDEFARTGGWDVGRQPPMALGVEAAGTALTAGNAAREWAPGDAVMTHPVPLRDQGTWAPRLIAPAGFLARKPPDVSWAAAAEREWPAGHCMARRCCAQPDSSWTSRPHMAAAFSRSAVSAEARSSPSSRASPHELRGGSPTAAFLLTGPGQRGRIPAPISGELPHG
jgi:Alcohol dehydrogenase GroES-like domain